MRVSPIVCCYLDDAPAAMIDYQFSIIQSRGFSSANAKSARGSTLFPIKISLDILMSTRFLIGPWAQVRAEMGFD